MSIKTSFDIGFVEKQIAPQENFNLHVPKIPETWRFFSSNLPECQVVYFSQIMLLFIVLLASIIGLMVKQNLCNSLVWSTLLGNSISSLIPSIKVFKIKKFWQICGPISSRQAVFMTQNFIIYLVVIFGLVNLFLDVGPMDFWAITVSGCVGFLMPSPTVS
jgi:hypothetical protein